MSHFYLTLPSNSSMQYYPNNTLTKYTTKLHNAISLQGEWEVGLSEIIFPKNWLNIPENQSVTVYMYAVQYDFGHPFFDREIFDCNNDRELFKFNRYFRTTIPKGYYKDVASLVNEINKHLTKELNRHLDSGTDFPEAYRYRVKDEGFVEFGYDSNTNLASVFVTSRCELNVSSHLADLLGIPQSHFPIITDEDEPITVRANRVSILSSRLQSMYVYCDVVECVPVGDTSAPLLRVVDVDSSFLSTVHRNFDSPRYLALRKLNFESLEIDIRDSFGDPIPFENGTVIVTLHFRRANSSYLLT